MTSRRRRTVWNDQGINVELVSGATAGSVSLVNGLSPDEMSGWTLTRVLIGLTLIPAIPSAVTGTQMLSLGLGLLEQSAFLAGATPDPSDGSDFPTSGWIYRARHVVEDDTGPGRGRLGIRVDQDIRAQRRFRINSYALMFANDVLAGTAFDVDVTGMVRSLYLLP